MSAIKKAIKGVGKFIKKHWKKIVIAAAIVFTAGAAAGGFSGLQATFAAKGVLGGIAATMKAGVAAIGGAIKGGLAKVGIGKGAAAAGGKVAGSVATKGLATLKAAAPASKLAAGGLTKAVGAATTAAVKSVAPTAIKAIGGAAASGAAPAAATPMAPIASPSAAAGGAGGAGAAAAPAAGTSFWNTAGGQALVQGGLGAAQALLGGEDENEMQGYYGVGLDGNKSLSRNEIAFNDANITGGAASFRRPLMYDDPNAGGG